MPVLKEIKDSFLHILFPHVCSGCGNDILGEGSMLCARCLDEMPETKFHLHASNPVEKIFWGRLMIHSASAHYNFKKESLMQYLMHQFKYKGNKELGKQLGRFMGMQLQQSGRFNSIDVLVPLPLYPAKEKRRGFNQATVLCEGIAEILKIEILEDVITRVQHTDTQTRKGRMERWENMEGKFELTRSEKIQNKHVLLVDDVVTTGATLEACGLELLGTTSTTLSIATLCFASR
ncbi:MAG TPA: phosphoribosyltransferase family protein [Chitinophagaceae bacterium]|nr:phosphoribosyltransferase family protein [Chitinophagaceae bacterium]